MKATETKIEKQELTVLSFGGGQDGTYILYKIIRNPSYRERVVKGRLLVLMSNTGNEHNHTYEHVEFVRQLCLENDIEFYMIDPIMGFHPNTWPSLEYQMIKNNSIMSMMMPRSCTDNLKIKPIYNFLNVWIATVYYDQDIPNSTRNRKWITKFFEDHGKINMILGIAAGEEARVKVTKKEKKAAQLDLFKAPKKKVNVWMSKCIDKSYPMIEEGIDRKKAQDYINVTPWPLPFPSNCIFCPFLTKQEILWMHRFTPDTFNHFVQFEINKLNRNPGVPRNLGVKGLNYLPQILAEAIEEFGHWTDEQLNEYKMSHGHCVSSQY
jgi:hypothetical protein